MHRKKILVTGARGLLGIALLKILSTDDKYEVLAPKRQELDLLNKARIEEYLKQNNPNYIVHLASLVFGIGGNLKNQMNSLSINTQINDNLLSSLAKYPSEKLFFAGTVAGYSYPYKKEPLTEDFFFDGLPHGGEFGYAMAKRHAYAYLDILSKEYGVEVCYGALTNLFGPHDKFDVSNGHVIPSLVAKAHDAKKNDTELEVWGNGEAIRDFLFVNDAANAIIHLLEINNKNLLVNISSGVGVKIRDMAETIADFYGLKDIRFDETKPTGIGRRVIDNSILKSTGFSSFSGISEGLENTCKWYLQNADDARTN